MFAVSRPSYAARFVGRAPSRCSTICTAAGTISPHTVHQERDGGRRSAMRWRTGARLRATSTMAGWRSITQRPNGRSAPSRSTEELSVAGSDSGGERAAAIYSLVRLGQTQRTRPRALPPARSLNPHREHPVNRIDELLLGTSPSRSRITQPTPPGPVLPQVST